MLYTVILGGGLIGTGIARWLIEAGSEVTIIEINADKVDIINASLGDVAIIGDAHKISDLELAGIERADSFIATSSRDDINLVACQIAKEKYSICPLCKGLKYPDTIIAFFFIIFYNHLLFLQYHLLQNKILSELL